MAFWGERNWFPVSYLCYMVKTEKSRVEQTMNRGVKLLGENTLSYKRSIDKHNFAVLLGTSMERYDSKKVKGTALNLWAEDDHKAWIDFTNSALPAISIRKVVRQSIGWPFGAESSFLRIE